MAAAAGAKALLNVRDLPRGGARRGEVTILACERTASVQDVVSQVCAPKVRARACVCSPRACCSDLFATRA
jgi:hypothetical protein